MAVLVEILSNINTTDNIKTGVENDHEKKLRVVLGLLNSHQLRLSD
jgi:hypothetical protein